MLSKFELRRQLFHLFFGLAIMLLLIWDVLDARLLFFMLLIGGTLSLLSLKVRLPIISWFLERFERKRELKKFPGKGVIFFVMGSLLVLKLFPKNIALAAIAILALGDSASHIIGVLGKVKYFNRTRNIEGILVGILVGFIGAMVFVGPIPAFFASLIAIGIEGLEVKIGEKLIDDNILVPLVAGTVIYLFETNFQVLL